MKTRVGIGTVGRKKWAGAAIAAAAALTVTSVAWACTMRAGQTVVDSPGGEVGAMVSIGAVGAYPGEAHGLKFVPPGNDGECWTSFDVQGVAPQYPSYTTGLISPVEVQIPTWDPEFGSASGLMRLCWSTGGSFYTEDAPFLVIGG